MDLDGNNLETPVFAIDKYKKAIEKTMEEIPVENGVITLEAIWLELTLPEDLMLEIFEKGDVELPYNVERVVMKNGKVLAERQAESTNGAGDPARLESP